MTKAYQVEGYHDIASFFQLKHDHPSTHPSAVDVASWAQEAAIAVAEEEEEEEEEEDVKLSKEHMVDVHATNGLMGLFDKWVVDRHTVDGQVGHTVDGSMWHTEDGSMGH